MLLSEKVILVTGSAKGIGFECAKRYQEEGALLAMLDLDQRELETAVAALGAQHLGIVCDVSVEQQVAQAIQQTIQHFGRLDAVHNNAGIAQPSCMLHETTNAQWDHLFDVNLKSVLFTTRYAMDALRASRGSILNTSSLVGNIGQANHAAYVATKGAMSLLTKAMALDYAPWGIRVNAVAPAGVRTPMLEDWLDSQFNSQDIQRYLNEIHPLGYCPKGDVIADAAVFLLSDMARFITGTILPVSGGAELGYKR
jgi:meso-butanediol dehydrogenase / (S,S)-butanediol dehydrogenase / diacetyl reductase